jgi:hypothetical protein
MKKISTAAAQKIEKVEGQQLTIGLDPGDRSSWQCVLNAAVREPNPPISSENSLFVSRPFGQELLLIRTWGKAGRQPAPRSRIRMVNSSFESFQAVCRSAQTFGGL